MIRAASGLPCPVGWLRSPLESALGWIALPFVQSMTGVSPDTAASVERLTGTVRGLEAVLTRLQTETAERRTRRSRQWRRRLAALEAAAEVDRTRAAALDAQLIALRAEVAALPALAAELATLREQRAGWDAIASDLTRQLDESVQRAATDRTRRQADAAAHVGAIEAGWRARVAALERDTSTRIAALERDTSARIATFERDAAEQAAARERNSAAQVAALERGHAEQLAALERDRVAQLAALERDAAARLAEAAARADDAHARVAELEAALALATRHADTLREQVDAATAGFAAERDALQAERAHLETVAAQLTHQLHAAAQQAATDRVRLQADATAHVAAVDAGWRARLNALERDAVARLAGVTDEAREARTRAAELGEALALAHRRADSLRTDAASTAAQFAAERDELQGALQAAAAREQSLAAQALQLEAGLAEVVSHADVRERAAAQRWQAWGEEVEARVARERLRLATALEERQHQIAALARALDDARATYDAEGRRRAADHERLVASAGELEVRLATAETQVEMERRAHDSALTDAYQTLTQREQDLEQMRQRAQRLETARATAVQELRALRAELESLRARGGAPTATAPPATPPAGPAATPSTGSGAGTMAGAISRLLKGGGGRSGPPSSDDESEPS